MKIVDLLKKESIDLNGTVSDKKETIEKMVSLMAGMPMRLVTDSPYFYVALTGMILGTQMFLSGFVGELISRSSPNRNNYKIAEEL